MRDAIGGSLLLNLVVIFTSIIILFFVGILSYSKAYKVKNKVIEVIERYDGEIMEDSSRINGSVLDEINSELTLMGYKVLSSVSEDRDARCSKDSSRDSCSNLNTSAFNYCICPHDNLEESDAKIFEVITYVQFEFPIIGDLLTFPVKGETKVLNKNYDY